MFETLELSDLESTEFRVLRKPSSTRPTLWGVEDNGVRAVVKDFSTNGYVFRNTIGRFLVWREKKAYGRLTGIRNIPTLYRVIDGIALVIEEISGKNVKELGKAEKLPGDFFQQLQRLLENIHGRGIAHCDLKTAANILIGDDGQPYLIDWAASISEWEFKLFPFNLIYQRFLKDDRMAVVKLKLRHSPKTVSAEERRRYYYRSGPEKLVRAIRDRLQHILQKVA